MMTPYPWQQSHWQRLMAAKEADRLPHAMLFSGPAGLGKRAFAEAFAAAICCASPLAGGLACGSCKGCRLLSAGTHPDFYTITPEEPGKNILVGAIRGYVEKAGLSSQLDGYKLVIIDPAEAMNISAANSLLKTLEEPVPWTIIMLVSSQPSRLPVTIRSRCQKLPFEVPDGTSARAWLAGQGVAEHAELLLGLAGGAPLAALALNQEGILGARQALLQDFISLLQGQGDPLEMAARWEKQELERLFHWMSGWVIDMLRTQNGGSGSLANLDQRETFTRLAARLDSQAMFALLDKVYEGQRGLRGSYHLNPRLLVEDLLLSVVRCVKDSGGN